MPSSFSPYVKLLPEGRRPSLLEKRLDNLKVFATLLVVLGHVGVFYSGLGVLEFPEQPGIKIMTWLVYSFHMPLFFFISGVIYGICIGKGKYGDVRIFVGKKVKRLLVPYLFWGIVVVTPVMELLGFTEDGVGRYVVGGILLGRNNRHLWYLLSLFCMFVVTDAIRRVVKNRKVWWVVLGIAAVAAILYNHAPGIFNIGSTTRCWVYFIAGVLLEMKGILRKEPSKRIAIPVVVIGADILCGWSVLGSFNDTLQRLVVSSIGIVICFLISGLAGPLPEGSFYQIFHRDSFGIYLAHPMIIYILMSLVWRYGRGISGLIIVPIVFIVALGAATGVTELIRKIQLSFVIGE